MGGGGGRRRGGGEVAQGFDGLRKLRKCRANIVNNIQGGWRIKT